ncbi:entericidin A/B family lipoprotein [Sphingopyxis sp. XHP0097]|uniref:Entericidin A/B family lipoprotein n=2 Tax=Sphingopyxis jiangsuensis TaxID=2871171 RepID=A0ABS7MF34_9SPHN|nr:MULTISPECIES: entericidin A/B family lipoprotein [Sphingopyxis]MBL0769288.1 entericidin A/B family lipoprotein [Sphingopyxis lutea]MBY4637605.1 entericidin A/B family lipoprotein [Sphingopyxis jiangsuensis]
MKKILTMFAISGSIFFLSACNTIEGAGKDIESVGECADGVEGNC